MILSGAPEKFGKEKKTAWAIGTLLSRLAPWVASSRRMPGGLPGLRWWLYVCTRSAENWEVAKFDGIAAAQVVTAIQFEESTGRVCFLLACSVCCLFYSGAVGVIARDLLVKLAITSF